VQRENFVAAIFSEECQTGDPCEEPILRLAELSPNLRDVGILMVQTGDREFVDRLSLRSLPGLGFYRNGDLLLFDGNTESEAAVMKFLTGLDSVFLDGAIEEVGLSMLDHLARESRDVFVFLYDREDGRALKVLRKLEGINDNLENDATVLLKCSEEGVEDEFGMGYLPRLVHLEGGVPVPYVGDLSNEGDVLRWIADALRDTAVKEVSEPVFQSLVRRLPHFAAVFYDAGEFRLANRMLTELHGVHEDLEERWLTNNHYSILLFAELRVTVIILLLLCLDLQLLLLLSLLLLFLLLLLLLSMLLLILRIRIVQLILFWLCS
jgi:hypothetical protein